MRRDQLDSTYRTHAPALYRFFAYRTGDPVLAEDLLADVFERALRAPNGFDPHRGDEAAWLYAIAVNRLRDHLRRSGTERRALERAAAEPRRAADAGDEALATQDGLRAALATLSGDEREVIALRFGADLTCVQIARVLEEPGTTVEGRLYRALRKLRAEVSPQ